MNETMNPEVKADWVAALRSGEFEQNQYGALSIEIDGKVKHCCLGVLCVLAVREGIIPAPETNTLEVYKYKYGVYGSTTYLPKPVREWAGITERSTESNLAEMNDEMCFTFQQIADYIERVL